MTDSAKWTWRARLNAWRRRWLHTLVFRPLWGERSADGVLRTQTRLSGSTWVESPHQLHLAEGVYVGPFNFIEASGGVFLEEGVQVTQYVSILTHSSHRTQRLMGAAYAASPPQQGPLPAWIEGSVHVGAYSFIGPYTVLEAGTRLGRGCIVASHSRVRGEFPDFSRIEGQPARRVGDTRETDARLLADHPQWRAAYEAWAGEPPC